MRLKFIQKIAQQNYLGIMVVLLSWILETTFQVMQQVCDVTTREGLEELVCCHLTLEYCEHTELSPRIGLRYNCH